MEKMSKTMPNLLRALAKGKPEGVRFAEVSAAWAVNRIQTLEQSLPKGQRTIPGKPKW